MAKNLETVPVRASELPNSDSFLQGVLLRRSKNVRTEMALNVLAYNVKRMVGIKGLMAAIPT